MSRASGPSGAKQDGDSLEPSISGDGSRVAFTSTAVNLPDDNDVDADVFVRDVKANTTTLASREDGDGNASANATAHFGEISSDGNAVAFSSSATNLPDAGDAVDDIFVRFLSSNSTVLVSRASGGTGVRGNGNSTFSSISSDGQFVAFDSASTNLVTPDDTDVFSDIYVRDVFDALTTLVSRESGATGARGDLPSSSPSISDDGGFTAFQSSATNFDPVADGNSDTDIYVRELEVPPSIALVPGGSCTGTTSGTMNMFVNDANTGTTGLTLSALSTNDAVVDPDTDVTFGGSGTNRTLTIAPSGFGSADLIVSVTTPDDTGDYFELLVDSGDDSPDGVNISGDMSSMVLSRGGADQVNTGDGIDLICAGAQRDTEINSGRGDDTIDGGPDTDVLDGADGNDIIRGGDGGDTLIGNADNDTLEGGSGPDSLFGGQHNDKLTGGLGADRFSGGTGTDTQTDFNASQGDTSDGTVP